VPELQELPAPGISYGFRGEPKTQQILPKLKRIAMSLLYPVHR
jgi:hypothetical protein